MGDAMLDYSRMKTYSIKDRQSKVDIRDFSTPWTKGGRFSDFLSTLPAILAGNDLRSVIDAVSLAAKNKRQVCFAMGGHDLETAMVGQTSEDVAKTLGDGSFGMAKETSAFLNQAIKNAKQKSTGLGK